jgi:hypothetical protein
MELWPRRLHHVHMDEIPLAVRVRTGSRGPGGTDRKPSQMSARVWRDPVPLEGRPTLRRNLGEGCNPQVARAK